MENLKAKVAAVNLANFIALEVQRQLQATFAPLVGKPVVKADGMLLEKVKKLLPDLKWEGAEVNFRRGNYSLAWTVVAKVGVDDGSVVYHEITTHIGDLAEFTLVRLCGPLVVRSDYTVAGVMASQQRASAAKKIYEQVRDDCFPFGEG